MFFDTLRILLKRGPAAAWAYYSFVGKEAFGANEDDFEVYYKESSTWPKHNNSVDPTAISNRLKP